MSRAFERRLIYAACIWQLITGFATAFIYSVYLKNAGSQTGDLSVLEAKAVASVFDSLYTFTVTYGLFFMAVASLNFIFVRKFVKDGTIQYKLPVCWICLAVLFYFLTDYLSLMLCLLAGVIALAKNKSIQNQKNNIQHPERIERQV